MTAESAAMGKTNSYKLLHLMVFQRKRSARSPKDAIREISPDPWFRDMTQTFAKCKHTARSPVLHRQLRRGCSTTAVNDPSQDL